MTDNFKNDFTDNNGDNTVNSELDYQDDINDVQYNAQPENDVFYNPNIEQRPRVVPAEQDNSFDYIPKEPEKKDYKKSFKTAGPFVAGVAATLAVGLIIYGVSSGLKGMSNKPGSLNSDGNVSANSSITINNTPKTDTSITNYDEELTPAQVAAKVKPSVVSIVTYDTSSMFSQSQSQGSGIIYSADGYIITNSHVIGDTNKNRVTVILPATQKEYEAKVLGYDTTTDLAVLKIDATGLTPAEFGNSDALVTGDMVLAVGNPGGVILAGSVSVGYVSGVNRVIDGNGTSTSAMKYIQTDAAINPGNSGGALVNMYGEVIGINTAKISGSDYEGLGFAIPILTAQPVVKDLSTVGYVTGRVKLGISCNEVTESMARYYGVPTGVYVQSIDSNSDLNGKVSIGDVITKINGKKVASVTDVQDITTGMNEGDTVTLTIYRTGTYYNDAKTFDVKVKLIADKGTVASDDNTATAPGNNGTAPGGNNYNNGGNGNYSYGDNYSFKDFFNSIF